MLPAVFRKVILKQRGNHISAVSRLTWRFSLIVRSVVHKVQQSCTVEKMSRERGFAEMMIAFYYYIFICRKKSRVFNG